MHFLVKLAKMFNDLLEELGYNGAGVSEDKGGKFDGKRLQKVENEEGQYVLFNYDDNGFLESVSDYTSRQCKFFYKGEYLSRFIDVEGADTFYKYDKMWYMFRGDRFFRL